MRLAARQRAREEEGESAFVSMTDMTVSFLFIVMILLAFFASQLHDEKTVSLATYEEAVARKEQAERDYQRLKADHEAVVAQATRLDEENRDLRAEIERLRTRLQEMEKQVEELRHNPLATYLSGVANQRRQLLEQLQTKLRIDFPDLQVIVSSEMDALRFKGDGLFQSGSSDLAPDKRRIVEVLAARLNEVLPCYTFGSKSMWGADCNGGGAVIEAVQIEGHTDSDGDANTNLALSTNRANATFFAMTANQPAITEYRNQRGQPVLSVAGYGKMRPVADNSTRDGKATNRRIDLRIIMYTPQSICEIEAIRERLAGRVGKTCG